MWSTEKLMSRELLRFKSSDFMHHLSLVLFKLLILCKTKASHALTEFVYIIERSQDMSYHGTQWFRIFASSISALPLSGFSSAKRRRSLLLFAYTMFPISGGLFWLATNSCQRYRKASQHWYPKSRLNRMFTIIEDMLPWKREKILSGCSCLIPIQIKY